MAHCRSASSIALPEAAMRTGASRSGTCLMATMIFIVERSGSILVDGILLWRGGQPVHVVGSFGECDPCGAEKPRPGKAGFHADFFMKGLRPGQRKTAAIAERPPFFFAECAYSCLGCSRALSSLARRTRALSSFFCTLAGSPGSTSAGEDLANS